MLKHNASFGETVELYKTVPGVGQLTAATLVAYLPELGRWDGRTLTSLVEKAGSVVARQREEAWQPVYSRRSWYGATSAVYLRLGGAQG